MPELSRAQVAVYGAIAVALLLIGARAIRGEGAAESSFAAGSSAPGSTSGGFTISGQAGDLVVDVTGAVARPGVYRMPAGSRVNDAGQRPAGAPRRAERGAGNLAARLADRPQGGVAQRRPS